eukprot:COSAG06_NODE_1261_length_10074_cov_21.232882_8_plen_67_part_00
MLVLDSSLGCAMQIFVQMTGDGRKLTFEVEGADSVESLRAQIHEKDAEAHPVRPTIEPLTSGDQEI